MSQDNIADALNMILNAKRAKKEKVRIKIVPELLIKILKMMKENGHIKDYKHNPKDNSITLTIGSLFDCRAIKPRYTVKKGDIDKYMRRFLPARGVGTLVVSTNQGIMTHLDAMEKQIGGCLIAYFY